MLPEHSRNQLSASTLVLAAMESSGLDVAPDKLRLVLRRWTRVVGKLMLLPYLRGLWGTLGGYLKQFSALKQH